MANRILIKPVQSADEIAEVRRLFREYRKFLGVDLCFQGFAEEVATLPGIYAPPGGAILLARDGARAVGCVALRPLGDGTCEMKRLYVRPEARGTGTGGRLAREIIAIARQLGYARMRLDTLERLEDAMRLYARLGFRRTKAYCDNPLPDVVYWERDLGIQH